LEDIELSFVDRMVLSIPGLAIHQFDRIGIVEKIGAGKRSFLELIAGNLTQDKGTVKRMIDFAYFDKLDSVDDTDDDYALMSKLSIQKTAIQNFSGGEQTRLKLASLFSNYHEGLLIDEPTTHLDEEGKQFLLDELEYYYGALVLV